MSSEPGDGKPSNEAKFVAIRSEAEAQGFYARHDQPVDFVNWSRESFWSAEEATALLFGLEPDDVKWDVLEQAVAHSAVADDISRLHKILKRAQSKGDLQSNGYPHEYAAWANVRRIEVPSALVQAISEFGRPIPNWDARVLLQEQAEHKGIDGGSELNAAGNDSDKLQSGNSNVTERDRESISGLKRKISSLQKICLGMALDKYQYNMTGKTNSAAKNIAGALQLLGIAVDPDTIRDHLADARSANPTAIEKDPT